MGAHSQTEQQQKQYNASVKEIEKIESSSTRDTDSLSDASTAPNTPQQQQHSEAPNASHDGPAEMCDELRFEHGVFLGPEGVQCTVCGRKCKSQGGFTKHLKSHGIGVGGRFVCPLCSKSLSSDYSLNRHYKVCVALKAPNEPKSQKRSPKTRKQKPQTPNQEQQQQQQPRVGIQHPQFLQPYGFNMPVNVPREVDVAHFLNPDFQSSRSARGSGPSLLAQQNGAVQQQQQQHQQQQQQQHQQRRRKKRDRPDDPYVNEDAKTFGCQMCSEEFTNESDYDQHRIMHQHNAMMQQMMLQKRLKTQYGFQPAPFPGLNALPYGYGLHPALAAAGLQSAGMPYQYAAQAAVAQAAAANSNSPAGIPAAFLQQAAHGQNIQEMVATFYEQQRIRQLAAFKSQQAEQNMSIMHPTQGAQKTSSTNSAAVSSSSSRQSQRSPSPTQSFMSSQQPHQSSQSQQRRVFNSNQPKCSADKVAVKVNYRTLDEDQESGMRKFGLPEPGSIEAKTHASYVKFLEELMKYGDAKPFCRPQRLPVPEGEGCPILKVNPLDLDVIQRRLKKGYYKHSNDLTDDIKCVFDNAVRFHCPSEPLHQQARTMQIHFEKLINDKNPRVGFFKSSPPSAEVFSNPENLYYQPEM